MELEAEARAPGAALRLYALPVFAATIFLSALLLFALEPMFTKMALPSLGGSPAVWSVAMVFFQGLMFAGYCYAHALTRWMAPVKGAILHGCVLALAFASLPVALRAGAGLPEGGSPAAWLIGVFTMSVGLPFFALSAHGPLLQAWFARSGHRQARDPYFLYGASNIGSFAALIAYPVVIEPLSGLAAQSRAWTLGFAGLAALIGVCAVCVFRRGGEAAQLRAPAPAEEARPAASLKSAGAWAALAFVPSALLVSVTAHISTEIAAAPLLWVIPLGLYLLSFTLTFRQPAPALEGPLAILQPGLTLTILVAGAIGSFGSLGMGLACHLALFCVNALVCHLALYRLRPGAGDLTLFYAAMSFGGALGGLFAGLAAPLMFSSVAEYPLLMAAAMFCRPGALRGLMALSKPARITLALGACAPPAAAFALSQGARIEWAPTLLAGVIAALVLFHWRDAGRVAVAALSATLGIMLMEKLDPRYETFRSFFGVHRVEAARGGAFRTLAHGTTLHGAIRIRNPDGSVASGRPVPTTYYAMKGPLGEAVSAARAAHGSIGQAAFIGLGAGALACHMRAGEPVTFFEIDPLVIQLARDSGKFRFLSDCAPQARFVTGDARLTLARGPAANDIIVVDAFSSDAIPVHLLTREAFQLYLSKLAPEGLIALHISNNTMEFSGIVARIAADLGLAAYMRRDEAVAPDDADFRTPSLAAVIARDAKHLGALAAQGSGWTRLEANRANWPWTDDYSTILPALLAKHRR